MYTCITYEFKLTISAVRLSTNNATMIVTHAQPQSGSCTSFGASSDRIAAGRRFETGA